jgi:predicted DNA repair protein MutK
MASGFFAILDDIGALMDDVAVAAKVATTKTAGILGDDLAVNAEKATGFVSSREIPVLWAITKGSLVNKVIIVPIALLLNVFFPIAIEYVLILGGLYLAYEGVEKIIEYFFPHAHPVHVAADPKQTNITAGVKVNSPLTVTDPTKSDDAEKAKIKSAITTDFILSIEIVIIALGTVLEDSLTIQIVTVSIVAVLATIGVYGIVAIIVRMDDAGFKLIKKSNDKGGLATLGHVLVKSLPIIIKILAVVGTIALILVSGGIFAHNIEYLHHILPDLPSVIKEFIFGLIAGIIAVTITSGVKKLISVFKR